MKERPILMNAFSVQAILDGRKTQTRRVITDRNSIGNLKASELDLSQARIDPGPSPYYNGPFLKAPCIALPDRGLAAGEVVERLYPRVQVGDRLWVRETWRFHGWRLEDGEAWIEYRATLGTSTFVCDDSEGTNEDCDRWERYMLQCTDDAIKAGYDPGADWWEWEEGQSPCRWRPSIYMPRWASRFLLEVLEVRPERIQDISWDDVIAEGIPKYTFARGCLADPPPDYRWKFIEIWNSINGKKYPWESNPWVWVVEFKVLEP